MKTVFVKLLEDFPPSAPDFLLSPRFSILLSARGA
jgi:hypothetical protein